MRTPNKALISIAFLAATGLACRASFWERTPPTPTPEPTPAVVETAPQVDSAALQGEPFVEVVAADSDTFNPFDASPTPPNSAAPSVLDKILPHLAGVDPESSEVVPSEMATGWVWAADGRTLTITLRSGVTWSDGAPVTAADAAFSIQALIDQGGAARPNARGLDIPLVEGVTVHDPQLLSIRLREPDCSLLSDLTLPLLPSHLFTSTTALAASDWIHAPAVGAGPFLFDSRLAGEGIVLRRNPSYWKGEPAIDPYRLAIAPQPAQRFNSVQSKAADFAVDLGVNPDWQSAETVQSTRRLLDGYSLLAINLANPGQPQPGREPTGAIVAQAPHPILGDINVRRAIAAALDTESIVRAAYGDAAAPLVTWVLPSISWAHDDQFARYGFNRDGAALLLEEAGWSLPAGETIRRKGDAPLQLTLLTNDDNPARVQMAESIRTALAAVGFDLRTEIVPFDDASARVLAQQYDLAIVGWEGLGSDPALADFFSTHADVPGSGSNITSYQSATMDQLLDEARAIPGCSYADRSVRYREAQRLVYEDVPVILLSGQLTTDAWDPAWQGVAPSPWDAWQGVEEWRLSE